MITRFPGTRSVFRTRRFASEIEHMKNYTVNKPMSDCNVDVRYANVSEPGTPSQDIYDPFLAFVETANAIRKLVRS